jgi:hypothetical protein
MARQCEQCWCNEHILKQEMSHVVARCTGAHRHWLFADRIASESAFIRNSDKNASGTYSHAHDIFDDDYISQAAKDDIHTHPADADQQFYQDQSATGGNDANDATC